jgi:hypothetical protein
MRDETIWRYLDFAKFVDLISTGNSFFCRSDRLGDPFEGSLPKKCSRRNGSERRSGRVDGPASSDNTSGVDFRKYVFANCWHMSDIESAALWRLYLKSDEGIAIRTTRTRLGAAFAGSQVGVWQVPICYIDYAKDDPPMPTMIAPFRYKRNCFIHENELRAVVFAEHQGKRGQILPPPAEFGIRVPTDLRALIEAVFVAPTAQTWLCDLVDRLCRRFRIAAPTAQSSLATDKPVFV